MNGVLKIKRNRTKEDEQNADFVDNDTGNNSVVDPDGLDFNL